MTQNIVYANLPKNKKSMLKIATLLHIFVATCDTFPLKGLEKEKARKKAKFIYIAHFIYVVIQSDLRKRKWNKHKQ